MLLIEHEEYGLMEHRQGQEDLEKKLAEGWHIVSARDMIEPIYEPVKPKRGRPKK